MNRKIIVTIIGTLILLALVILLWWLFFTKKPVQTLPTGSFGSAPNKTGSVSGGSGVLNGQQQTTGSGSGNVNSTTGVNTGVVYPPGFFDNYSVPEASSTPGGTLGADWFLGPGGGSVGGTPLGGGRVFTPSEINQLNSAYVNGSPTIANNPNGGGINPALLVGAVAIGCATFLVGNPLGLVTPTAAITVQVNAPTDNTKQFMDCLARTIARAALNQITRSVVQWINSGFNGKPSFVQNYRAFFAATADEAVGEFIKGSKLAFLCTAFGPQIRIAIAQSYANRNAQYCSLSLIVNNVNRFLNGNFSAGGWGGFLQLTSMPTNNPYGAYIYGRVSLGNAVADRQLQQATNLQLGKGFLPVEKKQNCRLVPPPNGAVGAPQQICETVVATPGSTVADAVNKQLGQSYDSLNLAKNFDEIISALVQQLVTRSLYGGLTSLSGAAGVNNAATAQAQAILTELQQTASNAQQFGSTLQGSIGDIQVAQQNLQTLANCDDSVASSTVATPSQKSNAATGSTAAMEKIGELNGRIDIYNNGILVANSAIATVEELQTQLVIATTPAMVDSVQSSLAAAQAQGRLVTSAQAQGAMQDRATLQQEMSALNDDTSNKLSACQAIAI